MISFCDIYSVFVAISSSILSTGIEGIQGSTDWTDLPRSFPLMLEAYSSNVIPELEKRSGPFIIVLTFKLFSLDSFIGKILSAK